MIYITLACKLFQIIFDVFCKQTEEDWADLVRIFSPIAVVLINIVGIWQ